MSGRLCASCGYDLSGAASGTCPECGYTPTAEEIALGERRLVFSELTRWRQWFAYLWPLVPFAMLLLHRDLWFIGVTGGVMAAASMVWAEIAGRMFLKVPGGQLRAARGVWRLTTTWLVLPFWGGATVLLVFVIGNEFLDLFDPWGSAFERISWRAPIVAAGLGFLATWRVWRWSWARLSRVAGLTSENRDPERARPAAKAVLWLVGPLVALPVLAMIMDPLLDLLRPEWW